MIALALFSAPSFASDTGHTAWMLTATALVLFMTIPGLSLFYAGLVRAKNVLSVLMQCFAITGFMSLLWFVAGYSIAFGTDGVEPGPYIGDMGNLFLANVSIDSVRNGIPETLFVMFQMTFAVITPALIVGGFAERMKFSAMLLFSAAWMLLVYAPVCHWVWGGGWLNDVGPGFIDFAGSTVVHSVGGWAALVAIFLLGARIGRFDKNGKPLAIPGHNLPLAAAGVLILWLGWFGFNGGSVLSADPALTSLTLVTTCLAAAAGGVTSAIFSNILYKNFDLTMFMNGVLGGLVGITAGADQMSPMDAVLIGAIAGVIIVLGVALIDKLRLDDPVGAVAVHLICGIWGTIAVGLFGEMAGLDQFLIQLAGVGIVGAFSVICSFAILIPIKATMGLRVDKEEELKGLDLAEHGMDAYADFRMNQH